MRQSMITIAIVGVLVSTRNPGAVSQSVSSDPAVAWRFEAGG